VPAPKDPIDHLKDARRHLGETYRIYASLLVKEQSVSPDAWNDGPLRKAVEDMSRSNLQAAKAVDRLNRAVERLGGVRTTNVLEIEIKLSAAFLVEKALEYEDPDIETFLLDAAERVHPDLKADFTHASLGLLVYGAAIRKDAEGARKFYRGLLPFQPEDAERFSQRALVHATAAYNMLHLFYVLNEPASARPYLDDLAKITAPFHDLLVREELSGGDAPRPGLASLDLQVRRPSFPPAPFATASVLPPKAKAAEEPEPLPGPKAPDLSGIMRKAAGLKGSRRDRKERRRRAAARGPRAAAPGKPLADAVRKERDETDMAVIILELFFDGCGMTIESMVGLGLIDEAGELFFLAESLLDPKSGDDSSRLAILTIDVVSRVPEGDLQDALCAGLIHAVMDRAEKPQATTAAIVFACHRYFLRFKNLIGSPEHIAPILEKLMALPRLEDMEDTLAALSAQAFRALGGGRGATLQTFPGPVFPPERLAALRHVLKLLGELENSESAPLTRAALGVELLCAALAAEKEDLTQEILEGLENDPDLSGDAETGRLLAQAALCVHLARLGRVGEAEDRLARLEKALPLPESVIPAWAFAVTALSLAHAREGRESEARELAQRLPPRLKNEDVKIIAAPLKEILNIPLKDPAVGDPILFRMFPLI
jgi:hypothetical protein